MDQPEISVIIPFLNEEEKFTRFDCRIGSVCSDYAVRMEVVLSMTAQPTAFGFFKKGTLPEFSVQIVKLSRNFGSHPAFEPVSEAGAPNCVWLGADLQNR